MENNPDPLAALLHEDALANRPAYSPGLHQRIMREINTSRRANLRFRWAVPTLAAAAMVTICATIGMRMLRPLPRSIAQPQSTVVGRIDDTPTEFQIKGICSATLWPPAIRIDLPTVFPVAETPTKHPAIAVACEGLPQLLMGAMQRQIDGANSKLADEIPPGFRGLFTSPISEKN